MCQSHWAHDHILVGEMDDSYHVENYLDRGSPEDVTGQQRLLTASCPWKVCSAHCPHSEAVSRDLG